MRKVEVLDERMKTCPVCNEVFVAKRGAHRKKTCSDDCRIRWNNMRRMARRPIRNEPGLCAVCAVQLNPRRNAIHKTCGAGECKRQWQMRKCRGWHSKNKNNEEYLSRQRERSRAYYEQNRERCRVNGKRWFENNPEKRKQYARDSYVRNLEKNRERSKRRPNEERRRRERERRKKIQDLLSVLTSEMPELLKEFEL